ncbi:SLAM family member 5-like [Hypanus sabinus]|uniref:SLAM family member 5-like n=1 Tax=Hypanus sabinus TaxID=79690 RepID=UPI0028C3D6A3|nr:SLAM family member 5-like [Hypanus sabinus]
MGAGQLLTIYLIVSISIAGTESSPTTVNGTQGQSVSLPPGIPVRPDIADVDWNRVSTRNTIVKYSKGSVTYFGTEEYKRRITLHLGNFSLEIRDLRREDSGDYEVIFTTGSGDEKKSTVWLQLYEPVSGIDIKLQSTGTCVLKLTCSVTSGEPTSFQWWRGGTAVKNDSIHHLLGHGEMVEVHLTAEILDVVYKCEAKNLVSKGTNEFRLKNTCQRGTTESSRTTIAATATVAIAATATRSMLQKMTLMVGLPVLGVILIAPLIVILVIKCRRRAAGRETSSNTEEPEASDTIYANVVRRENCHNNRQHAEENKRDMDEHCVGTYESPPFQAPRTMYC